MALNPAVRRRLATGTNAALVTVLVLAAVVLLWLVADRHRARVDLSASQASVLQEDTRARLRVLEAEGVPVTITAFTAQAGKKDAFFKNREVADLLDELDHASPVVEAKVVDFDRERLTAEALGVTEYGTVVVQRGDRRVDIQDRDLFRRVGKGEEQRLEFLGEAALQRAFAQLLSDTRRVVYALVGHGELDPESREPDGLSELAHALEQEHYALKRLDLVRDREARDAADAPRIPEDAAAVVVLRPRVPIPAVEEDVLLGWLAGGGPLLFAVEPGTPVPGPVGRLGVAVADGHVLDKVLVFPFPDRPVPRYRSHAITKDLADALLVTVVSRPAPLQPAVPPVEGVRTQTLLETSRDGWIERGGATVDGQARFDPGVDAAGPVSMAIAAEVGAESGLVRRGSARVVVVGDADLFSNALFTEGPGNPTFVVNTFRWLLRDDARLSVVGRPTSVRRLALTEEDRGRIRWLALGLGPVLAMVLGAGVWVSRRGR